MVKQKTIAQLRKEIAIQKKKIAMQKSVSKVISQRQRLSQELFQLKNERLIQTAKKAKKLSGRFSRGILRVGKKVAPVLQKQAKLIRDQQLRDDAIYFGRKKLKTKVKKTKTKSKATTRKIFVQGLGIVTQEIPRTEKRKKSRKKSRKKRR
jgi:hypothetical protein